MPVTCQLNGDREIFCRTVEPKQDSRNQNLVSLDYLKPKLGKSLLLSLSSPSSVQDARILRAACLTLFNLASSKPSSSSPRGTTSSISKTKRTWSIMMMYQIQMLYQIIGVTFISESMFCVKCILHTHTLTHSQWPPPNPNYQDL